ncbi:hypothetical protein AC578_9271 [Pseudocercospora eumusae]|uniref:Uncharacterized protein n=1 Tax=Pseudocercospora eumusae TaxID=321146 RepID=A0A139HN87_9PEZI|nr:hypothetical protein AC578_9271 [Pseudocercospora eumusae]
MEGEGDNNNNARASWDELYENNTPAPPPPPPLPAAQHPLPASVALTDNQFTPSSTASHSSPSEAHSNLDAPLPLADHPVEAGSQDDSSSEMDLSEPSRPATPEPLPAFATATSVATATSDAAATVDLAEPNGAKRKLSDAVQDADRNGDTVTAEEQSKKRKLSDPPKEVRLPPAVWQRIFMHCSPASLGRLLRVSKELNNILTAIKAAPPSSLDKSAARLVDSETIWTSARKTFFPQLPRPLARYSELEMLQLLGGKTCQSCGRDPVPPPATSVFTCGPGHTGVRVLYPFGVRSCGPCIEPRLLRDVQLLSDSAMAPLRLGLSFAYRSPDYHFAFESVRQLPGGIPGHLRFSKMYFSPDLEALRAEEAEAKSLGDGAVDEWRKGLFTKGKDMMADSARWEKWEMQLRLGANLAQVLREYDPSSFPHSQSFQDMQGRQPGVNGTTSPPATNGMHPLPQPVHVFQNGYGAPTQHFQPAFYYPPFTPAPVPQPHFRTVKNQHEVEQARQARKAEIERRCQELEPPVEPNVLMHMETFQAAMQITSPLTDSAWEVLKPRILAQREAAELAEHERASALAALQASVPMPISEDIISRPARETYDREYQDAQMPLRKKLAEYADDLINGQWKGGKMLDRDNIPIFAVQVLLHVKKCYSADKESGALAELEPPPKQGGTKHTTPSEPPFLSLDNMKWVYENKVRPFTDNQRKEHFVCAGCEDKPKLFAFEGLIQHYGAKHTSEFSKGNIIVHWETAKWPDEPPFQTNPALLIKPDRRVSDYRSQGRARNTPHGQGHESLFNAPPATPYANDQTSQGPGYPPQQYGQAHAVAQSNGYLLPPKSQLEPSHDDQVNQLSSDVREVWDALDGVKNLLECVRIQTVIHHAVARFKTRFNHQPVLDLLTDAMATNDHVRLLKHVSGLACKSCISASASKDQSTYWSRIRGWKLYNMSSLITHFKLMHQPETPFGQADWTTKMIEVPEKATLKDLMLSPGMDDEKLALIAAAFPAVFPSPLPRIGLVTEVVAPKPVKGLLERLGKKSQKAQPKKKGQKSANGSQGRDSSQEPLREATEDEYDPLRPALVQSQAPDPAQFDTDARKPSVQAAPRSQSQPSAAGTLNLAPETLAALQSLTSMTPQHQPQAVNDRASRSPSVGRAEPAPSSRSSVPTSVSVSAPAPVPASLATPTGPPDIAAILASLTGQSALTTPPVSASASHRPSSSSRQQHSGSFGTVNQQPTPVYPSESRRPSSRYDGVPQQPPRHPEHVAPYDVGELQAALSRNSRQYEQNQHQHQAYREPVRAAPAPPPAHSPPQYQYIYEDRHPYAQPAHTPVYREAPVQYIQVPEREYIPPGYQYERPASKPIYVDQYGRPLIPIDSAPAPVQYAPNPYEQQQYARVPEQHVYTTIAPPYHHQPVYDDRRPVYYEPVPYGASGGPPRYAAYDDGRASVPRS